MENDDGIGPSKEFPWSLLQKHLGVADSELWKYTLGVEYKLEYYIFYPILTVFNRQCTESLVCTSSAIKKKKLLLISSYKVWRFDQFPMKLGIRPVSPVFDPNLQQIEIFAQKETW